MQIANIAIRIPSKKTFDYLIPNNILPIIGGRVKIHFGNKYVIGIVISIKNNTKLNINKLKYIINVIDKYSLFSKKLLKILIWSSKYYHYPIGLILFNILPKLLRDNKTIKQIILNKIKLKNFKLYIKKKNY